MAASKPVVTLIGAGSRIFSFKMCTDICQTPALKGLRVRLVDVDADRLETMRRLFALVSGNTGMDLQVGAFTDRRAALPGSDYVILSVARDRIARWQTDLEISRRHGIVETQGECGGPGGLSLTLRNVPLVLEIMRDIEELAPDAVILNFSNPMTRVCHAIHRYTCLDCIGLCHGLLGGQGVLSRMLGCEVRVKGCGINHFNWIYAATWADSGEDAWATVVEAFAADDLPGWRYSADLFRVFGRLPSVGDGHVTDFLHHWRGEADGLNARYALKPKDMARYYKAADEWEARIAAWLAGERDPMADVKGLSGEGAIPILAARSGLIPPYNEIAANLPNRGCIANLPEGAIVELPARVSPGTVAGERMDPLPEGIRSLVARQLDIAELAVEAAVEGSREKALHALAIDPIVTDLGVARAYLDDILVAHADLLPVFA